MTVESYLDRTRLKQMLVGGATAFAVVALVLGLYAYEEQLHRSGSRITGTQSPLAMNIMGRLDVLQIEISQLKAQRLVDKKTIEDLAPIVVEGLAARLGESTGGPAAARLRADDLEDKLKKLSRYVNDIERSISQIDKDVSTPGVLEKKIELQRASTRP